MDWSKRNLPILDPTPTLPEPASTASAASRKSPCLIQGCCTCQPETAAFKQLRDKIIARMKSFTVAHGAKDLLRDGFLCMQLIPHNLEPIGNPELQQLLADMLDGGASRDQFSVSAASWFHISLHYFKPFRPTFQQLLLVESSPQSVCVEMSLRWLTLWELVKFMDTKAEWNCQFHVLQSTQAPVPALNPARVLIKASGDMYSLWPPAKRGRKRGGKNAYTSRRQRRATPTDCVETQHVEPTVPLDEECAEQTHDMSGGDVLSSDSELTFGDESEGEKGELEELLELNLAAVVEDISLQAAHAMEGLEAELARVEQVGLEVEESALAADMRNDTIEELAGVSLDCLEEVEANDFIHEQGASAVSAGMVPVRGRKSKADVSVVVPGGIITYYSKSQRFTATCNNVHHGSCVLTRSSAPGRRQSQGRPLGLLTGWLHAGQFLESKVEHWSQENWPLDHTLRMQQRECLMSIPDAEPLFQFERPQEPGEEVEPDLCP
eukprot:6492583-Amphidinium_carterae.2